MAATTLWYGQDGTVLRIAAHRSEDQRAGAPARSSSEIATQLNVGEATVETHINHIFAKAGVRDGAQTVELAYRTGLASTRAAQPDEVDRHAD